LDAGNRCLACRATAGIAEYIAVQKTKITEKITQTRRGFIETREQRIVDSSLRQPAAAKLGVNTTFCLMPGWGVACCATTTQSQLGLLFEAGAAEFGEERFRGYAEFFGGARFVPLAIAHGVFK
jgi:hypothetical protein